MQNRRIEAKVLVSARAAVSCRALVRRMLMVSLVAGAGTAPGRLSAQGRNAPLRNIALHRPYTLHPAPNYRLCTDPGDRTQLTDGVYTKGYFWVQKSTVGWQRTTPVVIRIDLGADRPIRGASLNTAAGTAGVTWPASIWVLVSSDNKTWRAVADLVQDTAATTRLPPPRPYRVFRYHTERLQTHGRYVTFLVDVAGPYFFTDEIEVYEGNPDWVKRPAEGTPVEDPMKFYNNLRLSSLIKRRLQSDLQDVEELGAPAGIRARVRTEAERIRKAIAKLPIPSPNGFRAVLPLNSLHAEIFRLAADIRSAQGAPVLSAWAADPWDFLRPVTAPPEAPGVVRISAMRGEVRSGAIDILWLGNSPATLEISVDPPPADPEIASDLALFRVPWTDTREGTPTASALVRLPSPASGRARFTVHPGLTAQVWLSLRPSSSRPAGRRRASVRFRTPDGKEATVPVELRVFDLDFPARCSLGLGGWDYSNACPMYGLTPQNLEAFLEAMREYEVDCPWATNRALPFPKYDKNGNVTEAPDTTNFDQWVEKWPDARRYSVFAAVSDRIAGVGIEDDRFPKMVGAWIRFWVRHAASRAIPANKLYLLLVDEPHSRKQDAVIVAWARALKAAEPEVNVWEDPTWRDPTKALPELFEVSDVLCPNRPMMLTQGKPFADFYRRLHSRGKRLDFYSCSGPARLLDPYAYYRLQAWTCFEMGADTEFFWALADNAGGDSWNEYLNGRTSFTPFFLNATSVTPAKQIEAVREGREDFEYLVMLRRVTESLEKANTHPALVRKGRALLSTACRRVLNIPKPADLGWQRDLDRTVADSVRIRIGEFLEACRKAGADPAEH